MTAHAETQKTKEALFAGGCFWCMEKPFDHVEGVLETTSGYTGGQVENPTYKQVSYDDTGHYEALRVRYNPAKVSYQKLLEVFWHQIDPLDATGQFCDKGPQYRAVIFVQNEEEKTAALQSKKEVEAKLGTAVVTEILPATPFWEAEEYHQNYYQKNPIRYAFYRKSCGRDARLKTVWGQGE